MEYAIYCGETEIGKAQVVRRGLYYEIRCTCNLPDAGIHRLTVSCGDRQADLGILVPVGNCFGLHTQIPIRTIGEGPLRFELAGKSREVRTFIPINPEEPFPELGKLKNAVLEIRDGMIGASIPKE